MEIKVEKFFPSLEEFDTEGISNLFHEKKSVQMTSVSVNVEKN